MIIKLLMRPSDSAGNDPEGKTTTEEGLDVKPEPAADPLLQLQGDLIVARCEADKWHDRFLRTAAEFENYRKRMEREREDAIVLAKAAALVELLPVLDACERALGSFMEANHTNENLEKYREGFALVYRQLKDTLTRLGVVDIRAKGAKFDPNLHEALAREETLEHPENTVIQELRKGYLYKDRLLRPAQVKVAIRPREDREGPARLAGEKDK